MFAAFPSHPELAGLSTGSLLQLKSKLSRCCDRVISPLRHRTVTIFTIASRLQRFQPAPDALACVIDRGGDDHRPLATPGVNLDDTDSEARRDSRLEPRPEHQRLDIPAPGHVSRRGWVHRATGHETLQVTLDENPGASGTLEDLTGSMIPATGVPGRRRRPRVACLA